MNIDKISVGAAPPWDINVIIEVPVGTEPVKYELDKASGALVVDRILHTSMRYPCNYGFVPHTLAKDGDPVDVIVANRTPIMPGAIVRCRPIGVLEMMDDGGDDAKIMALPVDKLHPFYRDVTSCHELPKIFLDQITHFFQHYKDLEEDKWTKIGAWKGPEEAAQVIAEAIERAKG
ncbi:inorganic pyrophosphatase [Rhodothalassium salexigens DSM 2132]|uniref:Inorganic pyrophosphatase n=1 Tax=Rhodothalassium salexigens DSM 2132 TaxID=1188247 RepID=A0A4R2PFW1_RHOSA|nr:inorganic diphosphatase [Rhodothalassium salexigens]MBB4211962.1 inorganic pyrophosphatase [Rhodothalassium salexigens DSM 2132]MBK1638624.1 inorganic pyrophosphatase [Rhodothalassium salexigens DSM 2132]TCP33454.1 inorganic pyrophosphatase [Rhodothalassium salexigens DSM 2132]